MSDAKGDAPMSGQAKCSVFTLAGIPVCVSRMPRIGTV